MAGRSKGVVIPISAEDNSARAFESVNAQVAKLRSQMAIVRAESSSMGGGMARDLEGMSAGWHNQTTEVQATSAAIRTMEGNPGIRAIERFLVMIPGVGTALLAAFPIIGAVALAGAMTEGIKKFIDMRNAARELADSITAAFNEAITKEREHADELAVSNDRLDEQVAKLEHKPSNGLAAGIDEAVVEANKLGDAMENAAKQADALFEEKYKVGEFSHLWDGTEKTDGVKSEVTGTLGKVSDIKEKYAGVIQNAADSGNSKEHIDELNQMMLAEVQDVYAKSEAKLKGQLTAALNSKEHDQMLGGTGARFDPVINSLGGSIDLYDQQQRVIGEQYKQSVNAPKLAGLKGDGASAKGTKDNGAEELTRRIAEAEQKGTDARGKADAQAASTAADVAKNRADVALAQLEDQHKHQLVSDKDYYAQKLAIQKDALGQEEAANYAKQGVLGDEIRGTIIKRGGADRGSPVAQLNDNARIIELQTQVNELETKRADIVAKRTELESQADEAAYAAAQKLEDKAPKLAAAVEAIRGGSTKARLAESGNTYDDARKNMVVQGASSGDLSNLDYQHAAGDAGIGLKGAEDGQRNADSGISTARESVKFQESSGLISQVQARKEMIDLDKQEADAMQPVLQAYEQLAALGVDGAAEKVVALKEKITELKTPINEAALAVSGQLNSAFEQLFANMDRGKKAIDDVLKSIQSSVLKSTYQQFILPQVQSATGALLKHFTPGGGSPGAVAPTPASAAGGLLAKFLPGLPGVSAKGGGTAAQVTIINQSSTPVGGTATSSPSSDMTDQLRGPVLQIMLHDLETGGSFAQALSGGGLLNG